MSDLAKLCTGNILLYDFLERNRNPTFLRRNLQRVLHEHAKELEERATGISTTTRSQGRPPKRSWKWPSMDLIQSEAKKQAFVLRILELSSSPEENSTIPEPLSKQKWLLETIELQITVTLKEDAEIFPCSSKTLGAQLQVWQYDQGRTLEIKMHKGKAFKVPLTDFALPNDPNDYSSPRHRIGKSYKVDVAFNIKRQGNNVEQLFEYAGISNTGLPEDPPTRWVAAWDNVKHCPPTPFLPLKYHSDYGDGRYRSLGLGVRVRMGWTKPTRSVLAMANQKPSSNALRLKSLPFSQAPSRKFEIIYSFSVIDYTKYDLTCPHCLRTSPKFGQFDDLRMHLDSYHDNFQHEFKKVKEVEGCQYWHCECLSNGYRADQRASDRVLDPREVQIFAPTRPFDQKRYLDQGDDSWQREARLEKFSKPPSSRNAISSTVVRPKPTTRRQFSKKKYKVPKAPEGVTFYRIYTKRPLEEGECISESEDDVDMEWLRFRTVAEIMNDPSIPPRAKQFLQIYNPYVRDAQIHSNVHLEEALVLFAREKGASLRAQGLVEEFETKVRELCEDNMITPVIRDACYAIAKDGGDVSQFHGNERPEPGKGKERTIEVGPQSTDRNGDVHMADVDNYSRSPPAARLDRCLCGQQVSVHGRAQIVYCENDFCTRHGFHVDCVMVLWKPTDTPSLLEGGWYCKECVLNTDFNTGEKLWYVT